MSAALKLHDDYLEMTHAEFMKFNALPENDYRRFELIDGYVIEMDRPTSNHQLISVHITAELHNYLKDKPCCVFHRLGTHLFKQNIENCINVYEPDIIVGCDRTKMTEKGYTGIPLFVVEVISPSTKTNDYILKRKNYMEYGVKEFWIVDMFSESVIVYKNGDAIIYKYTFNDVVEVGVFEGFGIDFKEISKTLVRGEE
jgi:Uma2 family endonuclease